MDMISLHDIQKSYGSHQVLKNVDLTVRQGEIYGLIGKNGAGKTTIFKIILGLTDFENGQLSIAGKSTKADLESGRKKIGFFIGKNFFDYLTAKENLEYYCTITPWSMHSLCWVGKSSIISRLAATTADWKIDDITNTAPLW